MESARQVTAEEGTQFAQKLNALFFEVSAMSGKNVTELFTEITKKIKSTQPEKPAQTNEDNVVVNNDKPKKEKRNRGFC